MEEQIDDITWFARLGRKMQGDLIACLDIFYLGYYEISAADAKLAREFHAACQPNKQL